VALLIDICNLLSGLDKASSSLGLGNIHGWLPETQDQSNHQPLRGVLAVDSEPACLCMNSTKILQL